MSLYEDKCWSRLERVITWSRMSTNRFASYIGLKRAETLYQIERGNNGLSRKLAEMIVATFPEISLSWLLTGSGDMFVSMFNSGDKIEYYNLDCERNIERIDSIEHDSRIILPGDVEADLAMLYMGDAMGSSIPTNSVVMLKRVDPKEIIYGKEYLVRGSKVTLLRVVRAAKSDDEIRLVAAKRGSYDDITLKVSEIEAIYRVTAKLIINY